MIGKLRVIWAQISDEPVVVFVGHALLLGSVCLDVHNVTDPIVDEVRREFDETLLYKSEVSQRSRDNLPDRRTLEFALEEITGTRPVTERVRHFKRLEGVGARDTGAT